MEDAEGWNPDPTGRHQERYFRSSGVPTTRVRNNGVESSDEAPPDGHDGATPVAGLAPETDPAWVPTSNSPRAGSGWGGSTLVASYREPTADGAGSQTMQTGEVAVASPRPVVLVKGRRNRWLVAAACVLVVLLVAASVLAVQQHSQAHKWMRDYHAEVSDYHAEVQKNAGLYATLVLTHQRLASCVGVTDFVLLDIATYFHDGYLPSSSKATAAAAGQTCQTTPQAQDEPTTTSP